MSNKEKCIAILNDFSENQLANIAAILQAAKSAMEEATDDGYCESLFKQYETAPDKGEAVSLEYVLAIGNRGHVYKQISN